MLPKKESLRFRLLKVAAVVPPPKGAPTGGAFHICTYRARIGCEPFQAVAQSGKGPQGLRVAA